MGKNKFMPGFIQKTLIKWSTIAALGCGAYFVGYFWGHKALESDEKLARSAEPAVPKVLKQPAHFSELVERVH